MYNVHEEAPVTFQTRWTMSYLAGPATRTQIKALMDPRRPSAQEPESTDAATQAAPPEVSPQMETSPEGPLPSAVAATAASAAGGPTVVPPDVPQYYLPVRGETRPGAQLMYQPGVLAAATIAFVSTRSGVSTSSRVRRFASNAESTLAIDWGKATVLEATLEELDREPYRGSTFTEVPPAMTKVSSYRSWGADFSDWAFRTQQMEIFKSAVYKVASNPGETEDEFRSRLQALADEKVNAAVEALRKKYAAKMATAEQQVRKAEQAVAREAEQSRNRKMQTAISFGATILSALTGRKRFSTGTLGRATTTMRDVGRSVDEAGDVKRAEENVAAAKQKLADLDAGLQEEIAALEARMDPQGQTLEKAIVRPRKSDITVDALGLVWMPYWRDASGVLTGAWG
jgi:hypothetical protein